ncbi:MAG TPA: hypothetical protein VF458_23045 [Ktedonobacteraceae bacterium]
MRERSFGTPARSPRTKLLARLALVLVLLGAGGVITWFVVARSQASVHAAPTPALSIVSTTVPGYSPWGLTQDHAGHIWVAEPECSPNDISARPFCSQTLRGSLIEYASSGFHANAQPLRVAAEPPGYSSPFFVVADASDNLWFTEPVTNALGELDHLGHWNQWTVSTPRANPFDLALDRAGHLWFTEPGISAVGEFNPITHRFLSFPTPTAQGMPYGITGPDPISGSLWFTENNSRVHRIGRFTPGENGINGRIHEYLAPATNNNTPHMITFDQRGNIWWSEGWAGKLGRLVIRRAVDNTSAGVSEYSVPTPPCPAHSNCGVHISGIAAASNGTIWFDDSLSARVGSYTPGAGFAFYTLDDSLTSNAHPHDGLIVDRAGNAWVNAVYTNQLFEFAPRAARTTA